MISRATFYSIAVGLGMVCGQMGPSTASGQSVFESQPVDVSASTWLWRWSPLQRFGDLGLPAPTAPASPHLLDLPAARVGLAWSGNPALLPDDIDSSWTEVTAARRAASGSYRRPLDPTDATGVTTSLSGWTRLGAAMAVIGRVAIDQESATGTAAILASPWTSSPFVPADTNRPAITRPGITLEGAQGVRLGAWRLGVALGYSALENHSSESTTGLSGRDASAGVAVGVGRALGTMLRAGIYARTLQSSEVLNLVANPAPVRVYALDGYRDVEPVDYVTRIFFRRANRIGQAAGAGLSSRWMGTRWVIDGQLESVRERQIADISLRPPTTTWATHGVSGGARAQRRILDVLATVGARASVQSGNAARDSSIQSFDADASSFELLGDLRYQPHNGRWQFATLITLGRDHQMVHDSAALISTVVTAWAPHAAFEAARRIGRTFDVGAGFGVAQYTPYASIPNPLRRGAAYRSFIAPGIEVAAATARVWTRSLEARWRAGFGAVSIRIAQTTTKPLTQVQLRPLPTGERSGWSVVAAVTPRR